VGAADVSLSNYSENAVLAHLFLNTAMASPVTVYAALFLSDPTDGGSGTELTPGSNSYARQVATFSATGTGQVTLAADLTWTDMPPSTITHAAFFDALTGGNMLAHQAFVTPVMVAGGEPFVVPAGNAIIELD